MAGKHAQKLFVGGLPEGVTTADFQDYFSQFGEIKDAIVMMKDGVSRRFGFVTFADPSINQNVVDQQHHFGDQEVNVQMADNNKREGGGGGSFGGFGSGGRGGGGKGGGVPQGPGSTDKIFVGGLTQQTTTEMLQEYFGKYGEIVDAVVMRDKDSERSRGFGFVRWASRDSVDACMDDYERHKVDDKWIECKRAVPQDQMDPPPRRGGRGGDRGGHGGNSFGGGNPNMMGMGMGNNYGGGGNPYGGYGPQRGGRDDGGYGGMGMGGMGGMDFGGMMNMMNMMGGMGGFGGANQNVQQANNSQDDMNSWMTAMMSMMGQQNAGDGNIQQGGFGGNHGGFGGNHGGYGGGQGFGQGYGNRRSNPY